MSDSSGSSEKKAKTEESKGSLNGESAHVFPALGVIDTGALAFFVALAEFVTFIVCRTTLRVFLCYATHCYLLQANTTMVRVRWADAHSELTVACARFPSSYFVGAD